MKRLLILSVFLIPVSLICQVSLLWESRADIDGGDDFSKDIVIDDFGNSYIVGTSFNNSQFDIITIKYDFDGNELWRSIHDGPANGLDESAGIILDSNGDVLITGQHQVAGADFDIFIKKLNGNSGVGIWTYVFAGTNNFDQAADISIDANDNVIVVGGVEDAPGDLDFIVLSVDTDGNLNWSNQYFYGGGGRDFANVVFVDDLNNIYVSGESDSGANSLDFYTIKFDENGVEQWASRIDGVTQSDRPTTITVADDGNVYVAGTSFRGVTDDDDIMLVKIDVAGAFVWSRLIGGTDGAEDRVKSIITDDLNNVYLVGSIKNIENGEDYLVARYRGNGDFHWSYIYQSPTKGFDQAKGIKINNNFEIYVSGYSNVSATSDDYLTVRLDTTGNEVWIKRFDGPASKSDQMSSMQIDDFGNIFVLGSSVGNGTLKDYSTIKYCQLETIASENDTICVGESAQLGVSGGLSFQWSVFNGDPITATNFSCTNCANPTASPGETTTYLVSGESASGCVDTDTLTVVVNPLPGPNITPSGPISFCEGGAVDLTADFAAEYNWNTGENQQTITADTAGTYSLVVTDAMGCQNSTDIDVEVFENPVVNAGADRFRCPGSELVFNGNGADSLVWFPIPGYTDTIANGVSYTPNNTGEFVLVGITPEGCNDRDTILVTIFPYPTQIELTIGMSGNLFVNTDDGSTDWYQNGTSLNHSGTSFFYDSIPYCEGEYSAVYIDENGCKSVDTIIVESSMTSGACNVGLDQLSMELVEIYPNPTLNKVFIDFDSEKQREIIVYSPTGQIVDLIKSKDQSIIVDLSECQKGTYFVTIISEDLVMQSRLVKQ